MPLLYKPATQCNVDSLQSEIRVHVNKKTAHPEVAVSITVVVAAV